MKAFDRAELQSSTDVIVSESRAVKFQEVDAAGTIYYARVFEYFGDLSMKIFSSAGLSVPQLLGRGLAAPLAHAEADYRRPLFFGTAVTVELVKAASGRTSVTLGFRIRTQDGEAAITGSTSHVFIDQKTFSPVDVPVELAAFLQR